MIQISHILQLVESNESYKLNLFSESKPHSATCEIQFRKKKKLLISQANNGYESIPLALYVFPLTTKRSGQSFVQESDYTATSLILDSYESVLFSKTNPHNIASVVRFTRLMILRR